MGELTYSEQNLDQLQAFFVTENALFCVVCVRAVFIWRANIFCV